MDAGILRALKTVKNNPYVQYVGLGLAGLVTQKEQNDQQTGKPLKKTKFQFIRISAAVCGIELCYAAETAFVSPILLKLGVPTSLMTMVWCLSPVLGFFLVPVMGSLSDRCRFKLGRRRPFIIILSVGIILGLALVPNGQALGIVLGDSGNHTLSSSTVATNPPRNEIMKRKSYKYFQNFSDANERGILLDMDISIDESSLNTENPIKDSSKLSFSLPSGRLLGIVLTIFGVAMLDFNCDACQSPCRAYLLDVCLPEDHSTGLTMFTVMAGAGGAVGYLMGGIDWNATSFGEAFGGHIRIVFTIVLIAFILCVVMTLTSFKEIPLSDLKVSEQDLQRKKKRKKGTKYRKFVNEDSFSMDEDSEEKEKQGLGQVKQNIEMYGAISKTMSEDKNTKHNNKISSGGHHEKETVSDISSHDLLGWKPFEANLAKIENGLNAHLTNESHATDRIPSLNTSDSAQNKARKSRMKKLEDSFDDQVNRRKSLDSSVIPYSNGIVPGSKSSITKSLSSGFTDEINPYAGWTMANEDDLQPVMLETVQISTDISLKTYLTSIVRMPRCLWVLCLCNLLCWMSLVCYSLYFTDFVGQAVFQGNPQARVDSESHIRYDKGVRLGSFGMSLYSLACAGYSLVIEKLVNRFRAKKVYVLGQLVFTVGMMIMAATRHKVAVILLSPSAGIMYATLFTMPYLLVAHYHTRGLFHIQHLNSVHMQLRHATCHQFAHGDVPGGTQKQVRGLGTDVAIISSMVFLAQFLLSVFMGTLVSLLDSTVTVMITSSVLSLLGAITATQITYLDL